MTETYPADHPRDIVDRLVAARPHLPIGDRVDNLVADWFRAAIETYAGTRDISAFAPFMNEFSGRSLIEGFQHFLDTQIYSLVSQPNPKLTEAEFTGLLGHAVCNFFEALGVDAESIAGDGDSEVDDLLFDYVGMLIILDPNEAFDWATSAIAPGKRLRGMTTGAGTPVPLRLLREFPDERAGIGSKSALAFRRAVFEWCVVNRDAQGIGPAIAELFPSVFACLADAEGGSEQQVKLLQWIVEPRKGSGTLCLIQILESELDLQYEDEDLSEDEAVSRFEVLSQVLAETRAPSFDATLCAALATNDFLRIGMIGSRLLQPLALYANPKILEEVFPKERSNSQTTRQPREQSMLTQIEKEAA